MALWGLIVPLAIAAAVAVVAQLRGRSYGRPIIRAGVAFAGIYFVYLVLLATIAGAWENQAVSATAGGYVLWLVAVSVIGGGVAAAIAALIGLPLMIDRRLKQRGRHDPR